MKIAVKGAQSQACLSFAEWEQFAGQSRKISKVSVFICLFLVVRWNSRLRAIPLSYSG
jgi:hypothetical protein